MIGMMRWHLFSNILFYIGRVKRGVIMYIFLIIIIILLILEKIINRNQSNSDDDIISLTNNDYSKYFYKKEYLLTTTELKFYGLLKQITDKLNLTLFCQVSMYEIINCKDYKQFNRIRSKCIDFVITEKNCKIKCCIELDDSSHNTPKRQKRDYVLDEIFKSAGVNLIRVKTQNYYNLEELENLIKNNI